MQANELKALLTRTHDVAFEFAHVEVEIRQHRSERGIYCPSNLIRGTVVKNGQPWVERRVISACGDQEYLIDRKSGVLMEIDPENIPSQRYKIVSNRFYAIKQDGKRFDNPYPHSEVVNRNGKKYIHLVTSRKAIYASWGEYELAMAHRDKQEEESNARRDRIYTTLATIMGIKREELNTSEFKNKWGILGGTTNRVDYDYVKGDWMPEAERHIVDIIQIPVDQAEKILNMLTDEQKSQL